MPPWPGSITISGRESGGLAGLAAGAASRGQRRHWHRRSPAAVRAGFRPPATARRRSGRPLRARAPAAAAGSLAASSMGIGDFRRSGQIEHDPRAAGHHKAIAERLDQSAARGSGTGRELEADLRNIDDHAIRIGQRKGAKLDGFVEIEDETGLLAVAGQAGIGGDRKIRCHGRSGRGGIRRGSLSRAWGDRRGAQQCCGAQQAASQQNEVICAARQRIRCLRADLITALEPQG